MEKPIKYVIFKTKWGYFGLAGTESGLLRTFLPHNNPDKVKSRLLKDLSFLNRVSRNEHPVAGHESRVIGHGSQVASIEFDRTFFKAIQEQIAAYFEGAYVNFNPDIFVMLDGFSRFCTSVLTACRNVSFGQTITYGELAKKLSRPLAARAVGNALAKNPLPLIIPCHRVIRSDGSLGGFSGRGGLSLKRKLLLHEQNCLSAALE
jgi:O-6-methylguanine DNA methyltransferase